MALIGLGEWLPDLPDLENPGALTALNVIPKTQRSYGPWKQLATLSSNALTGRPLGAFSGVGYNGSAFTFAGDPTKLYRYSSGSFSDVSRTAGYATSSNYYSTVSAAWDFVQFGNEILAANYSDEIQTWTMGTSSLFANLASSAPKGKYLAVVGDFLVVANTDDSADGQIPLRLWWSPIGSPATDDWGNTNLQSDFRTLPSGKEITGIAGGEYGLIFCRESIYRMTYAGPPVIFSIDEIESGHGCDAPGSIAQKGETVFYHSQDGFKMRRGQSVRSIGAQKVDATFFEDLDASSIGRVISTIDDVRKLYIVAYPGPGSTSGMPNKLLIYSYENDRWSSAEETIDLLVSLSSEALTVEALGAIYSTVESVPGSVDSPSWKGGTRFLAAFASDKMLAEFSGENKAMTIDTTERNLIDGRKAVLRKARAMIDTDGATINIGTRNQTDEMVAFGTAASRNSITGLHSFKRKGRYHRARIEAPAGDAWTEVYGIGDLEFADAGKR